MAFNPMNDFNAAYQTATNVELARQEANLRAVETNSKIKAQNIVNDINSQQLEQMKAEFERKQLENDVVDINEWVDAVQRGDIGAANWMLQNNTRLRSSYNNFGFKGLLMGYKEINPTLHQSTKEALARELGVKPEELDDNSIVYTQGDNGMPQAQYTPFWNAYAPKRQSWLDAKNYQTALQNLDVAQKTSNLDKTEAEVKEIEAKTRNTQATTAGKEIENIQNTEQAAAIQSVVNGLANGSMSSDDALKVINNIVAAFKGKLETGKAIKPSEQVSQTKLQDYNRNQKQIAELNNSWRFFSAAQLQDNGMKPEAALGIANLNYRKAKQALGITGKMTAAQANELMQNNPGIESEVANALNKQLSANESAKLLLYESLGLASAAAAGMSPGDVGMIDSYFGWLRDKTGIDFTDKPMEKLAVGLAGVLGTAQNARNNSYMSKAEFGRLLSLITSSDKSYIANLDALETTYTQNLQNIHELTRGVEMAEVVYAPVREATEQARELVRTTRVAYDIDSDLPNKIAATKYVKMSDGKMHLLVAFPPENADPNQDYSQVPDDSPIWYTNINGKLVNSQGKVYGGK